MLAGLFAALELLPVVAAGGVVSVGSMPLVPAGGHPLAPFVVGEDGAGEDEDDEGAEEDLHGVLRIAYLAGAHISIHHQDKVPRVSLFETRQSTEY